jgi:hypothetical protein
VRTRVWRGLTRTGRGITSHYRYDVINTSSLWSLELLKGKEDVPYLRSLGADLGQRTYQFPLELSVELGVQKRRGDKAGD